jgi:hypothetical protein
MMSFDHAAIAKARHRRRQYDPLCFSQAVATSQSVRHREIGRRSSPFAGAGRMFVLLTTLA